MIKGEIADWGDPKISLKMYKRSELGIDFVDQFKQSYSAFQYNTPYIGQGILHLLMGQLPSIKNMRIHIDANYLDTRFHIIWFQAADSGKGRGFNFAGLMCDQLNLLYTPVLEITDAALIGGHEQVERYDPVKKAKVLEYEELPGVLTPGITNVLAMNEASVLFNMKPNQNQKHAMDYYQIAMNTMGTKDNILPKKTLHGGAISISPDCSLFLSSYIPSRFSEVVATRGFAQRTFNIINNVTSQDRYEAMLHSVKYFNIHREKVYEDIKELVSKMRFINNFYKGVSTFESDESTRRPLANLVIEIRETVEDVGKFHRTKLEEFMHRYQDMSYKLMYHSCCLRLGSKIEEEDVLYARNYLIPVWKNLITYLEESLTQDIREKSKEIKIEHDVYMAYQKLLDVGKFNDKDGFIPRPLLKKMLQLKIWVCSSATTDKRLKYVEETGLLERSRIGKLPTIKAIRKPAEIM